MFATYGVDLKKPLTTMCYNSNAASLFALATYICGKDDTSVYFVSCFIYCLVLTQALYITRMPQNIDSLLSVLLHDKLSLGQRL